MLSWRNMEVASSRYGNVVGNLLDKIFQWKKNKKKWTLQQHMLGKNFDFCFPDSNAKNCLSWDKPII